MTRDEQARQRLVEIALACAAEDVQDSRGLLNANYVRQRAGFRNPSKGVCLSEQRRARLLSMARFVGRPQPSSASDDDVMHAVLGAVREAENRAWRAELAKDVADRVLREILSLALGAAVPAEMPVNPDAVLRQVVLSTAARSARG